MNTRLDVTVVAVIGALLCSQVMADSPTATSELFSFEKLAQYTSLASCFALIHEDFAYCNKKAEEKGRAYMEGIDESSEWAKRVKCCGTWKLRDCWVKFAKQKCDPMQAEQVHNLPYTFMKNLDVTCKDYPPNSDKCRFPVWLIVVIVLVGLSLLAVGIFCGVRCYRKRKLNQIRRHFPTTLPEEQKLKPPPV